MTLTPSVEEADAAPAVPDPVVLNVALAVLVPVFSLALEAILEAALDPVLDSVFVAAEAPCVDVDADADPVCVLVVPSNAKALVLYWLVALTYPGQVVLPITVTVVGWLAPSFNASTPVSQLQFSSPGQQYQSSPFASVHFSKGILVLLFSAKHQPGHCWLSHVRSVQVPR